MKSSLNKTVLLSVMLTVIATLSAGSYFIIQEEKKDIILEMKRDASTLSSLIADNLGESFQRVAEERNELRSFSVQIHNLEKLVWMEIYNRDGIIVAHSNRNRIGGLPSDTHVEYVKRVLETGGEIEKEEHDRKRILKFSPIHAEEGEQQEIVGVMELAVEMKPGMNEAIDRSNILIQLYRNIAGNILIELDNSQSSIQHMAEEIGKGEKIMWLEVFDKKATIIAHTEKSRIGQKPLPIHERYVKKVFQTGTPIDEEDFNKERFNAFVPYFTVSQEGSKEIAGVFELVMDMKPIMSQLDTLNNRMLIIVFSLMIVIVSVLSLILRKLVLQPVRELILATRNIASGDFTPEINIKSGNELEQLATSLKDMALNLGNAQSLTQNSERRLVRAQKIAHVGSWEWEIETGKLLWSDEIFSIFGFKPRSFEPNYQKFMDMIHLDDRHKVSLSVNQALEKGEPYNISHRIILPDGSEKIVHEYGEVRLDKEGKTINMLGTVQDITELKVTEEKLREAKEKAELASKTKSEFLANMSHEIRTPMTSVLGMAELLSESKLTKEQMEYVECLTKSGDSLIRIINDILDLSKVEAGMIELEKINFSFAEKLEKIFSVFNFKANKKGVKLKKNISPDVPDYFFGDPIRLRQVLVNLIGNALKFTQSGEIIISVECEKPSECTETCGLLISVSDTGIGIPEHKLEAIFDEFSQGDSSTTRSYGGTGLGLSISKKLVELMGGRLEVKSKEGEGSTFYFNLDLKIGSHEEEPKKELDASIPEGKEEPLSILLVEDSEDNRLLVKNFLKSLPHKLNMANNGEEAVEMFIASEYDLILMDMQMPVMDGYTATRVIRGWEIRNDRKTTPVIAFTAHALKEEIEKCIEAGCTSHLAKPIKKKDLIEAINANS